MNNITNIFFRRDRSPVERLSCAAMSTAPYAQAGSLDRVEMGLRLRASRDRLMNSSRADHTRAWRLWAACVEATASYSKGSDETFVTTLANRAGVDAKYAGQCLRQFNEDGVFTWNASPQGSRTMGMLSLPPITRQPLPTDAATVGDGEAHRLPPTTTKDTSSAAPRLSGPPGNGESGERGPRPPAAPDVCQFCGWKDGACATRLAASTCGENPDYRRRVGLPL